MSAPLLLGIDLGTSSVKALLVEQTGRTVGTGSAEYPILQPQPGFAEQEPEQWWQATAVAVRQALAGRAPDAVAAIGLSGQMHGTVLLGEQGQPLAPAVIWPDQRSREQVRALRDAIGAERLVEVAGSPVATGFAAATLLWMRQQRPALFARVACVLQPKDELRRRLTGTIAGDPSDASGALLLDVEQRDWADCLLDAVGVRRDQLPPLRPSTAQAAPLTQEAAAALGLRAGIPVAVGAADTACALLGAGATEPQTLVVNLSTGGQIVQPAASPGIDRQGRMHTFCNAWEPGAGPGWYQMGATLCVGMALRWLRTQLLGLQGEDAYERMTALAAEAGVGAGGLLFLPYLVGERTPHMDPQARGAFLGLTLGHGQAHLTRAVLEGTTFACYDAYAVLRTVAPPPESVVLAGGGARSTLWQQIVADVFGVPVRRLLVTEQSALGAALLAGGCIGLLQAAATARTWARTGAPVEPDAGRHARYAAHFALFQEAYRSNRALLHALSAQDAA